MEIIRNVETGKFVRALVSDADLREMRDADMGLCVACGEVSDGGCEPDARAYRCEECGKRGVYGFEELVLMGRVEIEA